ncbi:uncharacterized protein EV420DRAFT_1637966 [Desarmillaria tabescens]|uniref:REJ domain-containing protein n=1 Tax=Armillaria tabescens TaxID=1929756 RepID=A0AA39NEY4_ARMTA|nr:uncharacterized protein EV420DRAFT_1637966 [Desarmillaria tabescens]KAK0464401.1 hypothetical protein EV420DRAFT_1637966 [Desarmillaria tabescens]
MSLSSPPSASSTPSLTDASSTSTPTTTEAQSTSTAADTTPSLTTTPSATTQPTSTSPSTSLPVTTDTTSTSSTLPTSTLSSSAVVTTTSSSSVTSVLPSQTTTPTPIATSSSTPDTQTTVHQTSLVATTIVITQSNGQQLTSTSTVLAASSSAGAASTTTTSSGSSSSHTGAIVGGTIGGIAGVALLTALIWFLYKRNRSNRLSAHFDGNFDPDRIVARPPDVGLNLDDERDNDGMGGRLGGADIGAGVVSPFPISASTNSHGSSGQSYANYYSGSPASPPPMSQYSGESSGYPAAIFNPYAMSIPPRSPPPGSSSSGLGGGAGGMSAKEREARQNQLGVVNPDERSAYLANGPTGVVQHQDAGPSEIPPAYDSWGGAGASGSK